MKKIFCLFIIAFLITNFSQAGTRVILKLDDLSVQNGECSFIPAMDYLVQRKLKAGFGIIANRIDRNALSILIPYLQASNEKGEKLFELWHHGLDHLRPEFQGTGYDYQKFHFEEADQLIKEFLGVQMNTFGTPFNASDSVTNRVVSENRDYKIFMFSSVPPKTDNGILYLNNRVNMEKGTGNPEFDYFMENYKKYKEEYTDYMILQGHPNAWTPERLEQFSKIVDFLVEEKCEFVLPVELYNRHPRFQSSGPQ